MASPLKGAPCVAYFYTASYQSPGRGGSQTTRPLRSLEGFHPFELELEGGRVERVTVLEAGPCPVTAIRTDDVDGYVAVQLGFGSVREKSLTRAELGHLKKVDAPPMRTLVEFRDESGELTVGETVTVEAFEVGQTVKVSGVSKGKGFQGTIKRHNFSAGPKSHGSHNVRAPGSIGASATPSRVFKGIRGPGHMGAKRVTRCTPGALRRWPRCGCLCRRDPRASPA